MFLLKRLIQLEAERRLASQDFKAEVCCLPRFGIWQKWYFFI